MNITEHIKKIAKLSDETAAELSSAFIRKELPKGHFLFSQGDVCRHIFYIEKGFARVYYNTNSGKEITAWFTGEATFITAIDSFYQHKPTRDYCQLLEDSIVYSIKYTDFEQLFDSYQDTGRFAFYTLYEITKKIVEFTVYIKFQTSEERFSLLMQDYPSIFQRASLNHIASYLGITRETLSRIRSGK